MQILSPKHRVDILRDIVEAKSQRRPYVIVFCGVNGVGKSTNLAKVCPVRSMQLHDRVICV
jgi:signal recognition particle receptor subunit alpha